MYRDDMSIIISTTKGTTETTAMKIDFLIAQLGQLLQSNRLMLNVDKIELLRTTTRQQLVTNGGEKLVLKTKTNKGKNIPWSWTKILGMCFDLNLSFKSHFEVGRNALIPKHKKKLGTLKFLSRKMTIQQRNILVDDVIMNRIHYGITVWGNLVSRTQLERV